MVLELIALAALAYLAGLLTAGLIIRHMNRVREAPVPVDLGYDPTNPINRGGDPVEIEGVKLWRIC